MISLFNHGGKGKTATKKKPFHFPGPFKPSKHPRKRPSRAPQPKGHRPQHPRGKAREISGGRMLRPTPRTVTG